MPTRQDHGRPEHVTFVSIERGTATHGQPSTSEHDERWAMTRIPLLGLAVLFLSAGCASPRSSAVASPSPPSAASGEFVLPTLEPLALPPGAVEACAGVAVDGVLRGDPSDPRVAWLTSSTGGRIDVAWQPGYAARFDPTMEILAPGGTVVLRDGDPVTGGCVEAGGLLLIEPPFR